VHHILWVGNFSVFFLSFLADALKQLVTSPKHLLAKLTLINVLMLLMSCCPCVRILVHTKKNKIIIMFRSTSFPTDL